MKGGESEGETGMIEVPSDGDESSIVSEAWCYSYGVDGVTCRFSITGWRNVNSKADDVGNSRGR